MTIAQNGLRGYWNAKDGLNGSGALDNIAPGGSALPATLADGAYYDAPTESIHFDGVDDHAVIANDPMFITSEAFTFEYVYTVRATQTDGYYPFWGGCAYADTDFGLSVIYFKLRDGNNVSIGFEMPTNEIHTPQTMHVVIQHDNAQNLVRGYVNGVQTLNITDETRSLFLVKNTSAPMVFNYVNSAYSYLPVNFHAARFYDRALTPQEVADNYANGTEIGLTAAPTEVTGAASISASATQSTQSQIITTQTAALTATGDLTSSILRLREGATALLADAQINAQANEITGVIAEATIGSNSTIGTTPERGITTDAAINGAALLTTTAVAIIDVRADATLNGASSSSITAIQISTAMATLNTTATVTTSSTSEFEATSTMTSTTDLDVQPIAMREAGGSHQSTATLNAIAVSGTEVATVVSAESSATATAQRTQTDDAETSATADILATATRTQSFDASQITADGSIEAIAEKIHSASSAVNGITAVAATVEIIVHVHGSAALGGTSSASGSAVRIVNRTSLLDVSTGAATDSVRIHTTDSALTGTSTTDAPQPLRLVITTADVFAADAQAQAIAVAIASVEVTASGSAGLTVEPDSTKSALAALAVSSVMDADYASGYVTTARVSAVTTRVRTVGRFTNTVRAYGVIKRREGVDDD